MSRAERRLLALILGLGCAVRIVWAIKDRGLIGSGSIMEPTAWSLAQGLGLSWDGASPAFYPGPAYPFVVSLVYRVLGRQPEVIQFLQTALDTATIWAAYRLAGLFVTRKTALLAAALVAFYPSAWKFAPRVGVETLQTFVQVVLSLALAAAWTRPEPKRWALAGVVLGVEMLIKGVAIGVPFVLLAAVLWFRRDGGRTLRGWAVLCAAGALLVLPWTYRNYRLTGRFIPVHTGAGQGLWLGLYLPYEGSNPVPNEDPSDFDRAAGPYPTFFDPVKDEALAEEALGWVRERPGAHAWLVAKKLLWFWTGNSYYLFGAKGLRRSLEEYSETDGRLTAWLALGKRVVYVPLLLLLAVGAVWAERSRLERLVPILVGPIAWTLVHAIVVNDCGRFNFAVMPNLCILAAYGASRLPGLRARFAD